MVFLHANSRKGKRYAGGTVIEVTPGGKETLACCTNGNRVVDFDTTGKVSTNGEKLIGPVLK